MEAHLWVFGKERWGSVGERRRRDTNCRNCHEWNWKDRNGKLQDGKWQIGPVRDGRRRKITSKIMIKIKSCRFQSKAPEKTGALQKLRRFGWCIGRSANFVCNGQAVSRKRSPHPGPLPSGGRGSAGSVYPRVARSSQPWAGMISSFQDFGLNWHGVGLSRGD